MSGLVFYPLGYREAGELLPQMYEAGGICAVRVHKLGVGGKVIYPDLPWVRVGWLTNLFACLEAHGREDCMCWAGKSLPEFISPRRAALTAKGSSGSAYIGLVRSRKMNIFDTPWEAAYRREERAALDAYTKRTGLAPPLPDRLLPWVGEFFELLREKKHRTPSAAIQAMGHSRGYVASARRRWRWFDEELNRLGFPRRGKGIWEPRELTAEKRRHRVRFTG